jgi:Ran GTPase-activating protein 1
MFVFQLADEFNLDPGEGGAAKTSTAIEDDDDDDDELSFEDVRLELITAADALQVTDKIKKKKNLKTLNLSNKTIGFEAANEIGKALESHPELERLIASGVSFGKREEVKEVLKSLVNGIMTAKAHLVDLEFCDQAIGVHDVEGLADLLKSPSCFSLKELRLNNTGCRKFAGILLAETLIESFNNSGQKLALKVVDIGRSALQNEGAIELSKFFKMMGSLEEIVMHSNSIWSEGKIALVDAFSNNPNLRIVDLNDNYNSSEETGPMALALAKALPSWPHLTVLNLGFLRFKTEDAQLIADALRSGHTELEELYLDDNVIGYEGGKSIIEAVTNKDHLKVLNISGNQFGSDGCVKLKQQLEDAGKGFVTEEIVDEDNS